MMQVKLKKYLHISTQSFSQAITFRQKHTQIVGDQVQQKAYLSNELINKIMEDTSTQQVKSKSLSHRLRQNIQNCIKVNNNVKKQMHSYFRLPGIIIPTVFSQQQRITEGAYNLHSKTDNLKTIFCPTNLISGKIFQLIRNVNYGTYLASGHYGISKTYSTMLYFCLSNNIMSHIFRKQPYIPKILFQDSFLIPPKIVYWNFSSVTDELLLKKNILAQCPQITDEFTKNRILKYQYGLLQFYEKKNVSVKLIIDQINTFASDARKVKMKQLSRQNVEKSKELIKSFIKQTKTTVYLSSVNIEKQLLPQLDLTGTSNHSKPKEKRFPYPELIRKQKSMLELADFFLFQLGSKFKLNQMTNWYSGLDQKSFIFYSRLRQTLFQHLLTHKNSFFLTPYSISDSIKNTTLKIKNKKQLQQKLIQFLQDCISKTYNDHKDRFVRFLFKNHVKQDGIIRKIIAFQLYNCANKNLINVNQEDFQKLSDQDLLTQYEIFIESSIILDKQSNFDEVDKENFYIQGKRIYCLFPPQQILQMIKAYLSQIIIEIVFKGKNAITKTLQQHSVTGKFLQLLFMHFLPTGNTKLQLIARPDNCSKHFLNIQKRIYGFKSLKILNNIPKQISKNKRIQLKRTKNKKFLQVFKDNLQNIIQNYKQPYHAFLMIPLNNDDYKKSVNQQKTSEKIDQLKPKCNSKCIDFALIEKYQNPVSCLIIINAIDMTITHKLIKSKMQDFIEQFLSYKDRIVTSQQNFEKKIEINLNYFTIGASKPQRFYQFPNKFNEQFGKFINFKQMKKGQNVFLVNHLLEQTPNKQAIQIKKQNVLLKCLGHFSLIDDVNISQQKEIAMTFKELMTHIQKHKQ